MTETLAPSQSRSGLDRLFAVLGSVDQSLKTITEAPNLDLDREAVRLALACAKAGQVADGLNGRWSKGKVSRTEFRDACVVGAIHELKTTPTNTVTFEQILGLLPVSAPQLYTSLARLRVAGQVFSSRDGTRTPRYFSALKG